MTAPSVPVLFVMLAAVAIQPIVRCAKLHEEFEHLEANENDRGDEDSIEHIEANESARADEDSIEHLEANESVRADEDIDEGAEVEGSDEEGSTPEPLSESQLSSLHNLIDIDKDGRVSLLEMLAFSRNISKTVAMRDVHELLEYYDKSNDGKLSLDEYLTVAKDDDQAEDKLESKGLIEAETANFYTADEDGDKLLDKAEAVSLLYRDTHDRSLDMQAARRLKSSDKDGDGKLSFAELFPDDIQADAEQQAALHKQFEFMDGDGDGFVNASDIRYIDTMHLDAQMAMRDLLDAVDSDKDQHISLQELIGRHSHVLISDCGADAHLSEWVRHHDL